jgi:hypothetical protein
MDKKIAELKYDAEAETLSGTIGEKSFDIHAFSGGSRGHKQLNAKKAKQYANNAKSYRYFEEKSMFSRFANTPTIGEGTKKDPYKQRGGTLPPGHYSCSYIAHHKAFGECIYLKRDADTRIHYPTSSGVSLDNRGDDFYIHGSGPKGSDGCIVITDEKERKQLNKGIKQFNEKGHVILRVTHVAYLLPAERDDLALA